MDENKSQNTYEIKSSNDMEYPWEFLSLYKGPDRVVTSQEIREFLEKQSKNILKIKTGISALDAAIDGLEGGELIIVSGKTKNGKTTLCQTLTHNLAEDMVRCLWFSYEVPYAQFLEQMEENTHFFLPLTLPKHTLDWILDRIVESMIKHGTRVIFIDHLHFLIDMARIKNPTMEIGAIVRMLKRMAIDLNIVMFLVSHVRNIERGIEATEDDLRDSGMIKCEADSTWIVSRLLDKHTKEATNSAELKICNHRRTGVMGRRISLVKVGKYFDQYVTDAESMEEDEYENKRKQTRTESQPTFDSM